MGFSRFEGITLVPSNWFRTSSREQPSALTVVLILLLVAGVTFLGSHFLGVSQEAVLKPDPGSTLSSGRLGCGGELCVETAALVIRGQ
jgi:hypothetical protein